MLLYVTQVVGVRGFCRGDVSNSEQHVAAGTGYKFCHSFLGHQNHMDWRRVISWKSTPMTPVTSLSSRLPVGVKVVPLQCNQDSRGSFREILREEWMDDFRPVQWNLVHSEKDVLRGVHVHRNHFDYLVVPAGRMQVGLCDLRRTSSTYRLGASHELTANQAILIPPGVAHGFYFVEPAIHLYAVTHYWDVDDELGCHWDDPELGIPWQIEDPVLSPRDASLPPLAQLLEVLG